MSKNANIDTKQYKTLVKTINSLSTSVGMLYFFMLIFGAMAIVALVLSIIAYLNSAKCPVCINGTNGTDSIFDYADFYAIMPSDNNVTIALGGDIEFPQIGSSRTGTGITSFSATQIQLAKNGKYDVFFFVSITEAGQLELTLDGVPINNTVTGRTTGANYIMANVIITVNTTNSLLTVRNPLGNSAALTCTPTAGGTYPVSAHLKIILLG